MDSRCQYQTCINTRIEILCRSAESGVANPAPETSLRPKEPGPLQAPGSADSNSTRLFYGRPASRHRLRHRGRAALLHVARGQPAPHWDVVELQAQVGQQHAEHQGRNGDRPALRHRDLVVVDPGGAGVDEREMDDVDRVRDFTQEARATAAGRRRTDTAGASVRCAPGPAPPTSRRSGRHTGW